MRKGTVWPSRSPKTKNEQKDPLILELLPFWKGRRETAVRVREYFTAFGWLVVSLCYQQQSLYNVYLKRLAGNQPIHQFQSPGCAGGDFGVVGGDNQRGLFFHS